VSIQSAYTHKLKFSQLHDVLVLTGIELIFFVVASMGLFFLDLCRKQCW